MARLEVLHKVDTGAQRATSDIEKLMRRHEALCDKEVALQRAHDRPLAPDPDPVPPFGDLLASQRPRVVECGVAIILVAHPLGCEGSGGLLCSCASGLS